MIGKVPRELLDELVLSRTGADDDRVLQGPAYGEDAGAIRLGDDVLVVNPDPISMAAGRVGTLGVHVACNDVAASGGTPAWLTCVAFLPSSSDDALDEITRQIDATANELDVAVVAGHTEYAPALSDPMVVVNCLGLADRYVPTGGARPGDRLLVTMGAGIEATAILATDFADRLAEAVDEKTIELAESFYDDVGVVDDAAAVGPHANAMHDPTEGGIVQGALEMAVASGVSLEIDPEAVPVQEPTAALCAAVGVDPMRTFGSGALLASIPEASTDPVAAALDDAGIEYAFVGTVQEAPDPGLQLGAETITEPVRDEMYALWE